MRTLVLICLLSGLAQAEPNVHMQQAESAFGKGNYEQALDEYRRAYTAVRPLELTALIGMAECKTKLGEYQSAIIFLMMYYQAADALSQDTVRAEKLLQKLPGRDVVTGERLKAEGDESLIHKQYADAAFAYREAMQNSYNFSLFFEMAQAHFGDNLRFAALEDLNAFFNWNVRHSVDRYRYEAAQSMRDMLIRETKKVGVR